MTEVGSVQKLSYSQLQHQSLSAAVDPFIPRSSGIPLPSYSSNMATGYYNSATSQPHQPHHHHLPQQPHQQLHHHHHTSPHNLQHPHPHPRHPHHGLQSTPQGSQPPPMMPGALPPGPQGAALMPGRGMMPEPAALPQGSRELPPHQLQEGGGMYSAAGAGGAGPVPPVATMNGKKVPLTELPRYITTCYPFVQDSSTGAPPTSGSWIATPGSAQDQQQSVAQAQPGQPPHPHQSMPSSQQPPPGPPPPLPPHQPPTGQAPLGYTSEQVQQAQQVHPQQGQEYYPMPPGGYQVPPVPQAGMSPYQQGPYQQQGNQYQPRVSYHHPLPAPSPVPTSAMSQQNMTPVAPHTPGQSTYPYPAPMPHGSLPPGGYDASVPPPGAQLGMPPPPMGAPYNQYATGGYAGGYSGAQQKFRGPRHPNKDIRYGGAHRSRGQEPYQSYIQPPQEEVPKPKPKTVVFAEACAQTDFPESIANKPLSDKTCNMSSRTRSKARKKSQGNQTGRDDSSSSDSEQENTPHDSDSGYYSPLHAQQNAPSTGHNFSVQTGKLTYSSAVMTSKVPPAASTGMGAQVPPPGGVVKGANVPSAGSAMRGSNASPASGAVRGAKIPSHPLDKVPVERKTFPQMPPMGIPQGGPPPLPPAAVSRGPFEPVQPASAPQGYVRPPAFSMSYASMLSKPRNVRPLTAAPPPMTFGQRPPGNHFPVQAQPQYRSMAVGPLPVVPPSPIHQQRAQYAPATVQTQKPVVPEEAPKKRNKKRNKGKKEAEGETEKPKPAMVNATVFTKPPQIQDTEEYPGLPAGNTGGRFGMGASGWGVSYSSAVQQRPPPVQHMKENSSDEEKAATDNGGSIIKPEELLSPENVMSTIKEGKNARKRRKKAMMATQAAAKEYSEITEEQRQLQENMKKQSKRTKMPIEFDLGDMLAALEKQQQEIRARQQQTRGPQVPARNVQFAPRVTTMPPYQATPAKVLRSHNPLDMNAPAKRGKERELPVKKKPSALKRVILKEREEKKRLRTLEESRLSDEEPAGDDDDDDDDEEEDDEEEDEDSDKEGEEEEEEEEDDDDEEEDGNEEKDEEEEEVEDQSEERSDMGLSQGLSQGGFSQGFSQGGFSQGGFSQGFSHSFSHGLSQGLSQDAPSDRGSLSQFNASQSDLSPLSQMSPLSMSPLSPGSPLSSGLSSPATGMNRSNPTQVASKIHSRRFREYCNQVLDKDIDACCTTLLQTLVKFQDRQYHKDPAKAKMKRRLVMGLREVTKHLKLKKIRCIIVSPNLERIQSKGGLDEAMDRISSLSSEQNVPMIFALGRKALGRAVNKVVPVSVVGIFNYDGAEDTFKQLLDLSSKARNAYADMVRKFQQELEAANAASAARMAKHRHHMGHNRNLSGCSAISFSSVISEPISENYPNPEPEVDSQGREIEPEEESPPTPVAPLTPSYQRGGTEDRWGGQQGRSMSFTGTGSVVSNSTDDTLQKEERDGGSTAGTAGDQGVMSETSSRTLTTGGGEQDLDDGRESAAAAAEAANQAELDELEANLEDHDPEIDDDDEEEEEEEEEDEDAEVITTGIALPEDGAPEKRVADWVAEAQQCIESLSVSVSEDKDNDKDDAVASAGDGKDEKLVRDDVSPDEAAQSKAAPEA